MTTLFRQEVVEARHEKRLWSIIVAAPLSRWLPIMLALAAAIGPLLVFGHYIHRETVSGQLVPRAGLLNVIAPNAGMVTCLRVHDGQAVKAGEVLLELSSDQNIAVPGDTRALVGQQPDAQHAGLQADLRNRQPLTQQQADALRAKVILLHAPLTRIAGQLAIRQQQVTSNQQWPVRIEALGAKGSLS